MRGHTAGTPRAVWVASLLCGCGFASLGLLRFSAVHNETFDLAQYTRLAWGLAHAEPWDAITSGSFLGGHLAWVLAPLGVLGIAFGTAQTLICAQAFALALAAVPISRLATRKLGPRMGLWLALLYLAYPNLAAVASYEMHPGSLAVLPLAVAFDALDARNTRAFVLACACVLLCRASLALELSLLGLLAWVTASRSDSSTRPHALRCAGSVIALSALGYLALSLFVLRPIFLDGSVSGSLQAHFGHWGGSPFGVVRVLFEDPARVITHFGASERVSYLPRVLLPFAFLPLLAPGIALIAAPTLAINLLSEFPTTTLLGSHYLTPAVPVLAVASVHALAWLARTRGSIARAVRRLAPASALWAAISTGALLAEASHPDSPYRPDARTHAARSVLAQIPPQASVQAPYPLLPHLAERTRIHRGPPPERETDFVVLDLSHRARYAQREDLLRTQEEPLARSFLARRDHGLLAAAGELALLERGRDPRSGFVRRYFASPEERTRVLALPERELTACVAVRGAWLAGEALVIALIARSACPNDLALRIGTRANPSRADLLCEGLFSPAHFRAGDVVLSPHATSVAERAALRETGLVISARRSSGAVPEPNDPRAVRLTLLR